MSHRDLARAAEILGGASAIVVSAGAGMGVDSGLPDFRGNEGFWEAYPPYAALGLRFEELASPRWFERDPELAWGFYGHRLELYRRTAPHEGFDLLRRWCERAPLGGFVFTSNVDGQFQRAGFAKDAIVECHGAIDFVQCTRGCGVGIVAADGVRVEVDPSTFRARPPLPACPACGALARPNVLMFGDWGWEGERTEAAERRLERWLASVRGSIAVVECGAGTAIPSVRDFGERLVRARGAKLVRINVRESAVPAGQIGLAMGALAALRSIHALLQSPLA
jgi:NAD-dependent SIR2 family protein deacetylase